MTDPTDTQQFRINEEAVRVLMVKNNIKSLEELARTANLNSLTLRRLFEDKMAFKSETIKKLARALNCNPLDILIVEGYPDPHLGAPAVAVVN